MRFAKSLERSGYEFCIKTLRSGPDVIPVAAFAFQIFAMLMMQVYAKIIAHIF
jgi:hypothetical protein